MLKKSDLKVIRGGALSQSLPDEKFEGAYSTDTRLMGVLVIYIKWRLSGLAAVGRKSRILHQFYYVETTEEGIESYQGIYGDDKDELRLTEQSMLGGLGAGRVLLTMNEAVFLVQSYAEMTRGFKKPLPDNVDEYDFVLRREVCLGPEREEALFRKLCGEITSANQLINYFLMRYFSNDFFAARMLAASKGKTEENNDNTNNNNDKNNKKSGKEVIDCEQLPGVKFATLCRNEILPPEASSAGFELLSEGERERLAEIVSSRDEGLFVCESVIEEDRGHRIVMSEVGVVRIKGRLAVSSFKVLSSFAISYAEAAMKLARPEYATVYEIAGPVDEVLDALDERYIGALQNLTEGGKLYIVFKEDNRHMNNRVYLLNDDVKEILYVTVEDQLIIGSYTLPGIKRLENRVMISRIAKQLIEVARYEFKEQILYDYTMSYGGDFVRYVEEMMGFEDDDY